MGAIWMYIKCVYGYNMHVCLLCIWVLYTCMLNVHIGAMKMYIKCVCGCYIHVY